tara:strand:+ start:232 stop:558 length:327 start_codon:yes stop_codon:yes gene_type:complete
MSRHSSIFVFLLLCLVNWNCSSTAKEVEVPVARVPTKITSYPLLDRNGKEHKYKDNFDSFIFPRDNRKLIQYCAFHFEWEDIRAVYMRDKYGKWGYSYIVKKNKKSWK